MFDSALFDVDVRDFHFSSHWWLSDRLKEILIVLCHKYNRANDFSPVDGRSNNRAFLQIRPRAIFLSRSPSELHAHINTQKNAMNVVMTGDSRHIMTALHFTSQNIEKRAMPILHRQMIDSEFLHTNESGNYFLKHSCQRCMANCSRLGEQHTA